VKPKATTNIKQAENFILGGDLIFSPEGLTTKLICSSRQILEAFFISV
jgi:hypothetical protein